MIILVSTSHCSVALCFLLTDYKKQSWLIRHVMCNDTMNYIRLLCAKQLRENQLSLLQVAKKDTKRMKTETKKIVQQKNIFKKALRETQTLRAGGPKNFRPAANPLAGARNGQNLISWRWSLPLGLPTDQVW